MAKKPVWTHEDEIDFDAIYMCPMVRKDSKYPDEVVELTEVKIERDFGGGGYNVIALSDDYVRHFFYDNYLAFLLYTKYIYKK